MADVMSCPELSMLSTQVNAGLHHRAVDFDKASSPRILESGKKFDASACFAQRVLPAPKPRIRERYHLP